MTAIKPHSTAVSDSEWDGSANEARLDSGANQAYYRRAFAWEDGDGDPEAKSTYKFIHHFVSGEGDVGAASSRACSNGIAVLNGGRSGTTIPDGDRQGVYNHLARHLRDAGMEPPELMSQPVAHRLRGTPAYGGRVSPVVVDRSNAVIRNVSIFQSGVEALGHGVMGDAITLGMMTELGNSRPQGVKSRLGHPGMSEDGTAKQIGRLRGFRINGDKAVADLHLLESARISPKFDGDVVEWLLSYAEEAPEDFGLSVVIMADTVWRLDDGSEVSAYEVRERPENALNELPLIRPVALSAADIVDEPAANRDGLFSSLNDGRYSAAWAAEMFDEIDGWITHMGVSHEKAYQFAMRYFHARGIDPAVSGRVEDNMGNKNMLATAGTPAVLDDILEEEALGAIGADDLPADVDDFEFVEEHGEQPDQEVEERMFGSLQSLAEALEIGEIVSLVADLSANQEQLTARLNQMSVAIDQLTDALADSQRQLARANGFPVVTEDASLPYQQVLSHLLGRGNGIGRTAESVVDEERVPAPKAVKSPLEALGLEEMLTRPTSRQREDERVAGTLLSRWKNGG